MERPPERVGVDIANRESRVGDIATAEHLLGGGQRHQRHSPGDLGGAEGEAAEAAGGKERRDPQPAPERLHRAAPQWAIGRHV